MTTTRDALFIGTHGHVRALEKRTGEEIWTTSLPSCGYQIVTLLHEDGVLYAGSGGHVYAIDAASGELLWQNDLSGLGYGAMTLCTVLTSTSSADTTAAAWAQMQANTAAASGGASS